MDKLIDSFYPEEYNCFDMETALLIIKSSRPI